MDGVGLMDDTEANVAGEQLVTINDSGIEPFEFKVLVLPDESEVALKARRANILVPESAVGMYQAGTVTGTVVAVSPAAFSYHDWPKGTQLPQVGDRIVFARYAGMLVNGRPYKSEKGHEERREYRLLNDKDIAGILRF